MNSIGGSPLKLNQEVYAMSGEKKVVRPATERALIRALHLVLSIPIIGFIYGPVAHIPPAANFTRFIAVPLVAVSGIWLWQKPRLIRWLRQRSARKV